MTRHRFGSTVGTLAKLGICMPETEQLVDDGVRFLAEAFDALLRAIDRGDIV